MTRRVASRAAEASGPPPKVLPRAPGLTAAATAPLISSAPMGTPEARPLAEVTRSGLTPWRPAT